MSERFQQLPAWGYVILYAPSEQLANQNEGFH